MMSRHELPPTISNIITLKKNCHVYSYTQAKPHSRRYHIIYRNMNKRKKKIYIYIYICIYTRTELEIR